MEVCAHTVDQCHGCSQAKGDQRHTAAVLSRGEGVGVLARRVSPEVPFQSGDGNREPGGFHGRTVGSMAANLGSSTLQWVA